MNRWIYSGIPSGKIYQLLIDSLLASIQHEIKAVQSLTTLGLRTEDAVNLLVHAQGVRGRNEPKDVDGYYDVREVGDLKDSVFWWNDLERDSRYRAWSPSIMMVSEKLRFHTPSSP